MRDLAVTSFLVGMLGLTGCAAEFDIVRPSVDCNGVAIELLLHSDNLFSLDVTNHSAQVMVIDRDLVMMRSPEGVRRREPGGAARYYSIGPGEHHKVNVKYDLTGLRSGDQIQIAFDGAITVFGGVVAVPAAIVLTYR